MKVAHCADLHLGYRAYRRTSAGVNLRERDVVLAFREMISQMLVLRPEVVLIAGDVFHTPRPSNHIIREAIAGISSLTVSMPGTQVFIIGGNHDAPATGEPGNPVDTLKLLPNVTVNTSQYPYGYFCGHPPRSVVRLYPWPTSPRLYPWPTSPPGSVLPACIAVVVHGEAPDSRPYGAQYVALGHHHIMERVSEGIYYSGAIERTSNNIWAERGPKGFLTFDTEAPDDVTFHPLMTRPMLDLPPIMHANERYASEVADELFFLLDKAEVDGKLIRAVIMDCPPALAKALPADKIREYRARAVHLQLEPRRPAVRVPAAQDVLRGKTLDEELAEFISTKWTPSSADIDRHRVLELAQHYMKLANEDMSGGSDREEAMRAP